MERAKISREYKFSTISSDSSSNISTESTHQSGCGIGCFKPRWIQRFATPKFYFFIFCILGILQGAYFTYFIGVISTLEKRYSFGSKVTGLILIADNFGPILVSIFIGYFGGKCYRPRLLAAGMCLVAVSCFLNASPYFFYGAELHHSPDRFPGVFACNKTVTEDKSCLSSTTPPLRKAVLIFFLSNFLNGFGYLAYFTVGIPHLADIADKKDSPIYLSMALCLKLLGHTLGFLLSSVCLLYYENPFHDPGFSENNPMWIGAWWSGFVLLGVFILYFAMMLCLFPPEMPKKVPGIICNIKGLKSAQKLRDFPRAVRRVFRPLLVCNILSLVFHVNGYLGYFIFMPKYTEVQFRKSASFASLASGTSATLCITAGILLSGWIIRILKPSPRALTSVMFVLQLAAAGGISIAMFLGCPSLQFPGTEHWKNHTLNLNNECNRECQCTQTLFQPVCDLGRSSTYFSPCFAGCQDVDSQKFSTDVNITGQTPLDTKGKEVFSSCRCVLDEKDTFTIATLSDSYCEWSCSMLTPYVVILCISMLVSSCTRVGSSLITLRCVEPKDRTFVIGITGAVLALFACLPCPLIFGVLSDSACIVWEKSCEDKVGNCWLYDPQKLRLYLHGMSITFVLLGLVFDVAIFYRSDSIRILYNERQTVPYLDPVTFVKDDEEDDDVIYVQDSNNKTFQLPVEEE